jgi:hypothetical protein
MNLKGSVKPSIFKLGFAGIVVKNLLGELVVRCVVSVVISTLYRHVSTTTNASRLDCVLSATPIRLNQGESIVAHVQRSRSTSAV